MPQGASLFASCENTTTNGQVFYGTNGWEYQPNLDFIGLDTAYYEVNDNLGLTDQDMVVFHVTLEAGVEELRENTMSLYPNPTSSQLHVTLKESVKGLVSVKTIQGQEVIQQTINGDNLSLDVSHLSQGMYFMEIVGDDQVITETFEKQ